MMRFSQLAIITGLAVSLSALSGCNSISPQQSHAQNASIPAKSSLNLWQVVQNDPDFSLLVEAVQAAGLSNVLAKPNANFTIFAPTNAAFNAGLQQAGFSKAALFANKPLLTKILGYHVIYGDQPLYSQDLKVGNVVMLSNDTLMVAPKGQLIDEMGRSTNIIKTDIAATNGVIHVIDHVLMPQ